MTRGSGCRSSGKAGGTQGLGTHGFSEDHKRLVCTPSGGCVAPEKNADYQHGKALSGTAFSLITSGWYSPAVSISVGLPPWSVG